MNRSVALFLGISSLLASASAFAFPAVGDQVEYSVVMNGVLMKQVLTLVDYDQATDRFKKVEMLNMGALGQTIHENWVDRKDLFSNEKADMVMRDCATLGGTPEVVLVQGTGSVETCRMTLTLRQDTSVTNVGRVPFGLVHGITDGPNEKIEFTLISFKNGQ